MPALRETGADWGDGVTVNGSFGVTFIKSEELIWGGGLYVASQIEDDPLVIPYIVLRWKFAESMALNVTPGSGVTTGIQLELAWDFAESWQLALAGGYASRRFRLDDTGIAPDGVGEETSIPIYLRCHYEVSDNTELRLLVGMNTSGRFLLEDTFGGFVSESDYDAGLFVAFRATINF